MKAIILSAGRGARLLPITERMPKCLIPVNGKAVLEWQIDALADCGIDRVLVVTGFGAEQVDALLARRGFPTDVRTLYNPRFGSSDNLVSCWMARQEMTEAFVLLNGDTLFEPAVLRRLLESPPRPVTLAIDERAVYDDDDMKVRLDGRRLLQVGKDLPPRVVDGESIGLMVFRGQGPQRFREELGLALLEGGAEKRWYLSAIDAMARRGGVWTRSVKGLEWSEIDYPLDLIRASRLVSRWVWRPEGHAASGRDPKASSAGF